MRLVLSYIEAVIVSILCVKNVQRDRAIVYISFPLHIISIW